MSKDDKINVFIVDDDHLTIDLIKEQLKKSDRIHYFGHANSGEECLRKLATQCPDVVLMDIQMPGMNGIETTERLLKIHAASPPKIAFLSVYGDIAYKQKAFDLGASLLGKNITLRRLLDTIVRIYEGEQIINPNPNGMVHKDVNAKLKFVIKNLLSTEQIRIACEIRNGRTADEIAKIMHLSTDTINFHKKEIKQKLKPLSSKINAAYLAALMERCGFCDSLAFDTPLDTIIEDIRAKRITT